MDKLVRDKILEITSNTTLTFRKLSESDYKEALRSKLIEEATEVFNAKTKDELIEELADVAEVFNTTMFAENIVPSEVETRRVKKAIDKGGFRHRILMFDIDDEN